jgi:hypothetical protein
MVMKHRETLKLAGIALTFMTVVLAGDRVLSLVLEQVVSQSHNRHASMYDERAQGDILVVGNSRADRHFPPGLIESLTQQSVVNLGLGGESMRMSEILVMDYLDRYPPPKLLIVEATNFGADPGDVGDFRLFGIYSSRIRNLEREYRPSLYWTGEIFHLFRYNNDMLVRTLYELWKPETDRLHHQVISDALVARLNRGGFDEWEKDGPGLPGDVHPENAAAFERLLSRAADLGVPTRVVVTPFLHLNNGSDEVLVEWAKRLKQMAGPSHVAVWDYSTLVKDQTAFRDSVHMNAEGVGQMLNTMKAEGFFQAVAGANRVAAQGSGGH